MQIENLYKPWLDRTDDERLAVIDDVRHRFNTYISHRKTTRKSVMPTIVALRALRSELPNLPNYYIVARLMAESKEQLSEETT